MNIGNFMQWFLNEFVRIGAYMIGKLGEIQIYQNVSLLDFIITIAIIGAFISIVITAPNLGVVRREVAVRDRQARREQIKNQRRKG